MFSIAALMQGYAHALKLNGKGCTEAQDETVSKNETGRQSSRCQAVVCLLSLTLSALWNYYLNPHSALCICLTDLWAHGTRDVLFCTEPAIDSLCCPPSPPWPAPHASSLLPAALWCEIREGRFGTHNAGQSGAVSMYFRAVYCLNTSNLLLNSIQLRSSKVLL